MTTQTATEWLYGLILMSGLSGASYLLLGYWNTQHGIWTQEQHWHAHCTRELVTLLSISSDIITCLSFHHISLFITISSIRIIPRSHASSCCYLVTFFLLSSLDSLFRIFFLSFLKIQHSKGTKTSTLRLLRFF